VRVARGLPRLASCIAMLGLGALPAEAAPSCPPRPALSKPRPMAFSVRERPGRRPVLIAEGTVDAGLMPRLRAAIDAFSGDELWLRSAGGDERVGRVAAQLIRGSNLITRIPAGWTCGGACAFMFLGGFARFVEPGGLFVVRSLRPSAGGGPERAQQAALRASEDNGFLLRMGVWRTLLDEVLYRPLPGGADRCLTQAELRRYNVTNVTWAPPEFD